MKRHRINTIVWGIFVVAFGFVFSECGDSGITLTATNCPRDSIRVTESTRITTQSGNQWQLNTVITITCGSTPIPDAEVEVKFWWPKGTYKLNTDGNGQIPYRKTGHGTKPSGESFEVRIVGSDGERTEVFTIP